MPKSPPPPSSGRTLPSSPCDPRSPSSLLAPGVALRAGKGGGGGGDPWGSQRGQCLGSCALAGIDGHVWEPWDVPGRAAPELLLELRERRRQGFKKQRK